MPDIQKSKRTSRLSVVISVVLHLLIVGVLLFFAAREGMLGKQLKKIAVTMVPKEKPPEEKPKEKPPEPKPEVEPPKTETQQLPPPQVETAQAPPPAAENIVPAVAPPSAAIPAFDFEGGKAVETSSDPNVLYKGSVEYALRSHWNRPDGVADDNNVAEVEVSIDAAGRILNYAWVKKSGDTAWDDSIKKAFSQTTSIGRVPPKGFPGKILVRFDVQAPSEVSFQ